jgi:hypothetical protein
MSNKQLARFVILGICLFILIIATLLVFTNVSSDVGVASQESIPKDDSSKNQSDPIDSIKVRQKESLDKLACETLVAEINEKYPVEPSLFYPFKSLFMERVTNDNSLSQDMLKEASLQMAFSTLSPAHVAIYKQGTARKKPVTFNIKKEKRSGVELYQLGILFDAIEQNDFSLAEVWLTNVVEANPNKPLLKGDRSQSLLVFAIEETIKTHGFGEQNIFGVLSVFTKAGYKIHFLDLFAMTDIYLMNSDARAFQIVTTTKMLFAKYKGDINHVFNYDISPSILHSINLIELALWKGNFLLAQYWQEQGVEVMSNLTDPSHVLFYPDYDENSQQTQAVLSLLESGALTYKPSTRNEEQLNKFLPQKNAQFYFERFVKSDFLSSEQKLHIQNKVISFARDAFAMQSKAPETLPEECSAQYLNKLNLIFGEINSDAFTPSKYIMNVDEQKLARVINISNDRNISKKEKFERLRMIDGRFAKQELDTLLLTLNAYGEDTFSDLNNDESLDLSAADEILMSQADDAAMRGDYILFEALLEQMQSVSQARKLDFKLALAISANASPETVARMLQEGANVDLGMFTTLLANGNLEALQVILNYGYSADYNAEDGYPLLRLALLNEAMDGFMFLLEAGADIELPIVGLDALDIALKKANVDPTNYIYIKELLARGKVIEESHREVLRELLIKHPAKTKKLLDEYGVIL